MYYELRLKCSRDHALGKRGDGQEATGGDHFDTVVSGVAGGIGHGELTELLVDFLFGVKLSSFLLVGSAAFEADSLSKFGTRRRSDDLANGVIFVTGTKDHSVGRNSS